MIPVAIGLFTVIILAAFAYSHRTTTRLRAAEWDVLVSAIEPIHARGLQIVALDHLHPEGNQLRLEPAEMWGLLGGKEGLRRMQHNADLIIALAAYVNRWNYEQAVIVAERIRHDSILLKRALFRIRWHLYFSRKQVRVPFYLHEAASAYYLMTRRLLALYETHQFVLYPKLAESL